MRGSSMPLSQDAPRSSAVPPEVERSVCVVMHDVTGFTWPDCEKLLDALAEVGPYPSTLLLVPEYTRGQPARRDARFCAQMTERLGRGDELALHGFRHHDDSPLKGWTDTLLRSVYTNAEGEFSALTERGARLRLEAGAAWFAHENWPLDGFVAPAWLLSPESWQALERLPIRYATTLNRIVLLPERTAVPAPSLVFSARSAWRRAASHAWVDLVAARQSQAGIVRLGLHPQDARHPGIVLHWQRLFERFLRSHTPRTKAAVARLARHALEREQKASSSLTAAAE